MSNPQVKDGFTSIAHELLEAITIYPFSKMQYKILMVIFRKTYGYGKQIDDIALSHYVKHTGMAKPHVSTTLISLEKLAVISKHPGVFGFNVSINKHYRKWEGWNSDWDFVEDSVKKQKPFNQQKKPEQPQPDLTAEQNECWKWAKNDVFWCDKVATQADFIKHYESSKKTLKTQHEAFKSKTGKYMTRLEEKNNRGKTIKRKSFLNASESNEKIIEGEVIND
jgi:phage replication O-like protein O